MGTKDEGARLPVLGGVWGQIDAAASGPPTLDQARRSLGGPWRRHTPDRATLGTLVRVAGRVGVVIHATSSDRDVWIDKGTIRRTSRLDSIVELSPDAIDDPELASELDRVAADAQVHASVSEGQQVVFLRRDGSTGLGVVAEKLRYGALVGVEGGAVLAVSFRRLAPTGSDAKG